VTPAPLVLLDLDGTLTDSAPGIVASARAAYAALGLPVPDDEVLRTFVGPPITESFPAHGVPPERVDEAIDAYRTQYVATGMWDNSVFDGIPAALVALRDAGATLLIATAKPAVYAKPIAERFGLAALTSGVFGPPDDDAAFTKARVVGEALASLPDGYDPARSVMVGDREHDVRAGRAHGIATLGVRWGYAQPGELEAAGVTGFVERPADLPAAVLGHLGLALSRRRAAPAAAPTTGT
jgi:phosphoglycolate phosphatase